MPRISKQLLDLVDRSAKSVPADGCHADFDFVLMSSSSAEGLTRHVGYVCRVGMHGDVQLRESVEAAGVLRGQLAEAERTNTQLTEQVAEICGGRWLSADLTSL